MVKKILIIDDESDSISFIGTILEDNGYDYISADNGVEGLELTRKEMPDLILLDLIMPEKSGITMFQELKRDPDLSHIPVVVVSGVSQVTGVDFKNFTSKLKAVGENGSDENTFAAPDGFVEKPIDPREMIEVINDILS
ncbi:MAG: response regulator [Deltaproteobacteria bacterium]|nr:response regulator [Deltaproteobacteria bacterium]